MDNDKIFGKNCIILIIMPMLFCVAMGIDLFFQIAYCDSVDFLMPMFYVIGLLFSGIIAFGNRKYKKIFSILLLILVVFFLVCISVSMTGLVLNWLDVNLFVKTHVVLFAVIILCELVLSIVQLILMMIKV